ncbi:MAG: exonuclease SbcCD subunit D [Firmicutes bacterium]|nr:exonuclease SbcCD subunit D [Bacillota bacterium]
MRILHTADWHLGRTLEGRDRLPEQEAFIDELCAIADDQGIQLVLIAGDVFDTVNPPAAAEELYYDALARLADYGRRRVIVIAGNHDSPDRLTAPQPLAERHGICLLGLPVQTGLRPLILPVPGSDEPAVVAALPYPSEARLNEVLTAEADEAALQKAYSDRVAEVFGALARGFRPDAVRLAMSHLFVAGGKESDSERPLQVGLASAVAPSGLPQGAHYIALGHLHRPQTVHAAPSPARYSGSPLAYSFSEAGQAKSVVVIDAGAHCEAKIEEIHLSAGRPLVRWKAEGGLPQVEAWCAAGRDANAWVDLELHLTAPLTVDQIGRLRSMHPGIVAIRPVFPGEQEAAAAGEGRSRLPADELFRRFYLQRIGAEPDEELVRLFVSLLAEDDGTEDSEDDAQ